MLIIWNNTISAIKLHQLWGRTCNLCKINGMTKYHNSNKYCTTKLATNKKNKPNCTGDLEFRCILLWECWASVISIVDIVTQNAGRRSRCCRSWSSTRRATWPGTTGSTPATPATRPSPARPGSRYKLIDGCPQNLSTVTVTSSSGIMKKFPYTKLSLTLKNIKTFQKVSLSSY